MESNPDVLTQQENQEAVNPLIEKVREQIPVDRDLQEAIESVFKTNRYSTGQIIQKENQYCRDLHFIASGLVRTYHFRDGKDITSWFYHKGQFMTSWYSFFSGQAGFENMEVIEEAVIHSIDHDSYRKLMDQRPLFARYGRLMAEEQLAFLDYYFRGYMFMSAEEKYAQLLEYIPEIELKTKLRHIASFIGVSQETLSRIRSKK